VFIAAAHTKKQLPKVYLIATVGATAAVVMAVHCVLVVQIAAVVGCLPSVLKAVVCAVAIQFFGVFLFVLVVVVIIIVVAAVTVIVRASVPAGSSAFLAIEFIHHGGMGKAAVATHECFGRRWRVQRRVGSSLVVATVVTGASFHVTAVPGILVAGMLYYFYRCTR
jgi:hypothetical protein